MSKAHGTNKEYLNLVSRLSDDFPEDDLTRGSIHFRDVTIDILASGAYTVNRHGRVIHQFTGYDELRIFLTAQTLP